MAVIAHSAGLLEGLLVFCLVLGLAVRELLGLRRGRRADDALHRQDESANERPAEDPPRVP